MLILLVWYFCAYIFRYGITSESKKSIVPLTKCDQQSGENCFVAFEFGIEAARFVQALQSHVIQYTLPILF